MFGPGTRPDFPAHHTLLGRWLQRTGYSYGRMPNRALIQDQPIGSIKMSCDNPPRIMERSLREILADSHISAVATAVLLLWSLDSGFQAFWRLLFHVGDLLVNVVALGRFPFGWRETYFAGQLLLIPMEYLLRTMGTLVGAWVVSRWVYGAGPLRSLSTCRASLIRRSDV